MQFRISALKLNHFGTILAVANDTGTQVEIYETSHFLLLKTLYRGYSAAIITSMDFDDRENEFFLMCSNKGTVHLFYIGFEEGEDPKK